MELEKIAEGLKKIVAGLDKGVRLEAVLEGKKDEYRVVLFKGNHSDRTDLARQRVEDFLTSGKNGPELRKAIGKVISKLNRTTQRGR